MIEENEDSLKLDVVLVDGNILVAPFHSCFYFYKSTNATLKGKGTVKAVRQMVLEVDSGHWTQRKAFTVENH